MSDQTKLHNELAGRIVMSIVKPVLDSGGSLADVMILTESILVGVALAGIRMGGDNKVLDVMFERARERLTEIRLRDVAVAGSS